MFRFTTECVNMDTDESLFSLPSAAAFVDESMHGVMRTPEIGPTYAFMAMLVSSSTIQYMVTHPSQSK